jgi:tRNA-dihydrouridine synthase B
MNSYQEKFSFANLLLPNNIFYAPMAGHTDLPFRRIASSFRPGLFFCEMVKIEGVVRKCKETLRMLEYTPEMHPIGAQICGSNPLIAMDAAKQIEALGFDWIDLNCGCPVDKVTKDGSGSALLRDLPLMRKMIASLVRSVRIPVSVKVRSGWDEATICVSSLVRMAEEEGATAITIHGRTRKQKYEGVSNLAYIEEGKKNAQKIIVLGNGDVRDSSSAERMFQMTQCDGLMIARGALSAPWIVQEIRSSALKIPFTKPSPIEILLLHFSFLEEYYPKEKVIFHMKRVACYYLKGMKGVKKLRVTCNHASSVEEMKSAIALFQQEGEREDEEDL